MKKILVLSLILCASLGANAQKALYKNPKASTQDRVQDLVGRMSINEKIGQLCCPLGWEMYTKDGKSVYASELFKKKMNKRPLGSFWATLRADPWTQKTLETGLNPKMSAQALNALQKYAVEETRLGIPILFAEECPHGHMAIGTTVFPTSLLQASTFNEDLIERMGRTIGLEARLQGANIGYGPILDVAREPRWSRMEETFGEDPLLIGTLGSAFVRGLQGKDMKSGEGVYSTLKHFAAYGVPIGGHNGNPASVGKRQLFTDFLPPFKKAVEAGAATIMTSYNSVDGVPSTSNKFLLDDVLRKDWGFKGAIYSDLGSIEGVCNAHHIAPTIKHAAAMALKAGVDFDLGGNAYGDNLEKALKEGLFSEKDLNKAVARILRLKFEMGLFENPYVDVAKAEKVVGSYKHKKLAREVARQGIVLLKNDGLLPLSKDINSIAVIGPNADNIYNQLGDYTAPQERERIVTVLDAVRNAVSKETKVTYAKGCAIRDTTQSNIEEAVEAARNSDIILYVVGGSSARDFKTKYISTGAATISDDKPQILSDMECGEGFDRSTLHLLGDQEKLMKALSSTGKPMVVVYIEGRPLNMNLASEKANALLTAWYPGQEGGHAITDILFGDYNPAGRLPVSVPRSVGQLPVYYSLGNIRPYIEEKGMPLYSFGYGLSYTSFDYSNLRISSMKNGEYKVSFTVKNVGDMGGEEVAQLYLRDNFASVSTSPIQLKHFTRFFLKKGEKKDVTFTLTKDDLSIFDANMDWVAEPGTFTVMIGAASTDIRLKKEFKLK